jgi:hypothetical protein
MSDETGCAGSAVAERISGQTRFALARV